MWRLFRGAPRAAADLDAGGAARHSPQADCGGSSSSGNSSKSSSGGSSSKSSSGGGGSSEGRCITGHERVRAAEGRALGSAAARGSTSNSRRSGATADDSGGGGGDSDGSAGDDSFELVAPAPAALKQAPEPATPPPSPSTPPPPPRETRTVDATLCGRATARVVLEATTCAADARVLYALLADPRRHARIFDAIESADASLLSTDGPVSTFALDYRARWRFWKLSGSCTNKLIMTADAARGTVAFRLREPGFLRAYEGVWAVAPLHSGGGAPSPKVASAASATGPPLLSAPPASRALAVVRVTTETTPARAPPPPINQALKAQARAQAESMLDGLLRAAAAAVADAADAADAAKGGGGAACAPQQRLPLEDLRE